MKVFFEKDADYDVYKRDYYPLLLRNGFSWRMFPELGIYLDMKYPGMKNTGNSTHEHIKPDLDGPGPDKPAIFVRMITLDEWVNAGAPKESYKQCVQDGKISSLPHEIGHYIHLSKFGNDGSLLWLKACALMGVSPSFKYQREGSGYSWRQSYEDFANYFEACIEGRIRDEVFMDFVRGLFGIKYRIYTNKDYIIQKDKHGLDRAWVPVRLITETFKDGTLRDIEWLGATREVVVITAESGF